MNITITLTPEAQAILQWRTDSMNQTLDALLTETAEAACANAVTALSNAYAAAQDAAKEALAAKLLAALEAAPSTATSAEIVAAVDAGVGG